MNSLTIATPSNIRIFNCLVCGKTINTSLQKCTFCRITIDPRQAQDAADQMDRLNFALNEFRGLKTMEQYRDLRVRLFMFAAVRPFLLLRWWTRYRAIDIQDADFEAAQKEIWKMGLTSVGSLLLLAMLIFLEIRLKIFDN